MAATDPPTTCPGAHHEQTSLPGDLHGHFIPDTHDQYVPTDFANPYLDLDPSLAAGQPRDDLDSDMHSFIFTHSSGLIGTSQAMPNMVLPQAINPEMTCPSPQFSQEACVSPLDLTELWQPWAAADGQITVPDAGRYLPEYDFPICDVQIESALNSPDISGESGHDPQVIDFAIEISGSPLRRQGFKTGQTPKGRERDPPRASIQRAPALSASKLTSGQPGQFVFVLEDVKNNTRSTSKTTLQAHPTILDTNIPQPVIVSHDIQIDYSSSIQQSSNSTNAVSTSHPMLDPRSSLSSAMAPSSTHIDLYNTRARNRIAASRCRVKQKASIAKLKEAERNIMDERFRLLDAKKALTDQVCALKELLFMHAKCKEDRLIGEYLELTANRIVDKAREAVEQQQSPGHAVHFSDHFEEEPFEDDLNSSSEL